MQATGFAAALLAGCATVASAIDQPDPSLPPSPLSIQFKGGETLSWESNPLMLPTGAKALFGSVTSPEVIINDATPTSSINLDTLINENVYDQSAFNSTDLHETVKASDQNERWGMNVTAKADYDTTRSSELTTFGLDLANVRHTGLSAAPQITYNPTAVDKLALTGSVANNQYNNPAYIDFDLYSITPSYSHNFDPMNAGTFSFLAQRYQTTQGAQQTNDTFGPSLGWVSTLTPTLVLKLEAGVQKSLQSDTGSTNNQSDWNYVFSSDLAYTGQQDQLHLVATRAQYPFANGLETLLTTFSATETHALNESFSLNAAGTYQFAKSPPSTTVNLDSQYNASAGITYHMYEHLDLTASYQYRNQSLTDISSGNIRDNEVLFGLVYHPVAGVL